MLCLYSVENETLFMSGMEIICWVLLITFICKLQFPPVGPILNKIVKTKSGKGNIMDM